MKIYTKTGDKGETGLFGGKRVSKADARVATYGDVDELNSALGIVRALGPKDEVHAVIMRVQNDLFRLGSELACVPGKQDKLGLALIDEADTVVLEQSIDAFTGELAPLTSFILPGGSPQAAALHAARTIARRAERATVTLAQIEPLRPEVIKYLNRLSDWLFVAARFENSKRGVSDIAWEPRKQSE